MKRSGAHWRGPLKCGCTTRKHYGRGLCGMHYQREFVARVYKRPTPERMHKYKLWQVHGLTVKEFDALLKSQNYACAICKRQDSGTKKTKHFFVDHNHQTNIIRGLLCSQCNVMLGNAKDSPTILRNAAEYLEKHS